MSTATTLAIAKELAPSKNRSHGPKGIESPHKRMLRLPSLAPGGASFTAAPRLTTKENPFRVPSDGEVFELRDTDKKEKDAKRNTSHHLKIYEKNAPKAKNFKQLLSEDPDDLNFYERLRKREAAQNTSGTHNTADRSFGREVLQEFITKKREMFLVQYALGVKKEEMRKLEEIAQAEEKKLLDDEKALEEDAAKFDAFLKENDKNSVEAMKKAELETKAKLERMADIKKLNIQLVSIRSDMSKNEDQLKDLMRYRRFLEKLTPKEFLDSHGPKKASMEQVENTDQSNTDEEREEILDDSVLDEEQDPVLYFQNAEQLLNIFAELEENNLALIQNCQETEETLEELRVKIADTEVKMQAQTTSLKQQIQTLDNTIAKEEEKAKILEERANLFLTGVVGADAQEKMLEELNQKVRDVYRNCVGDNDANLSTLEMLTYIENRLEALFEAIEVLPADKVELAEKLKDKERRQRVREDKLEAQRLLQEERVQRALERAKAPVKKKTGKPIMFRSAPPPKKKKEKEGTKKKDEEDLAYYFS